jgi:RimJ/RimL family protein N-acetyltransferase
MRCAIGSSADAVITGTLSKPAAMGVGAYSRKLSRREPPGAVPPRSFLLSHVRFGHLVAPAASIRPTITPRPLSRSSKGINALSSLARAANVASPPQEPTVMFEPANYSAFETLRDGRRLEIRALRPDDRADLIAAVDRSSGQSLYRRFFAVKRSFTESEIDYFLNVDFVNHVALVAIVDVAGQAVIAGGARYVVVQPGKAEIAFTVADQYQGQGVGTALMHHLATIARGAGLKELIAEVLPDNVPMLKVFEKSGSLLSMKREPQVVHVALRLC